MMSGQWIKRYHLLLASRVPNLLGNSESQILDFPANRSKEQRNNGMPPQDIPERQAR